MYLCAYLEHLLSLTDGELHVTGCWIQQPLTHSFSCPDPYRLSPGTSNKRRNCLKLFFKLQQVKEEYRGRSTIAVSSYK